MKVAEIFQVETPHAPGSLASVLSSQQILRDIYTPGTARVCLAIRAAPEKAFDFTYLAGTRLPDPLDVSVHERVSQAVQAAILGSAPAPPASTSAPPS